MTREQRTRRLGAWAAAVLAVGLTACGGGGSAGGSAPPAPVPAPAPAPAPTAIAVQPQAQTVDDGTPATFSVSATGAGTLRYQWLRNEQPIAGATAAQYTTPPLTLADHQSTYRVTVTGDGGTVSSAVVALTVRVVAPTLLTPPAAVSVADGERAGFAVQVSGSAPIGYQWLRNGQAIVGATASQYTVDPAQLGDNGATFAVRVTNAGGELTSPAAALSVKPVPATITQQPSALTVADGVGTRFSVSAKGSAPLAYQWLLDGQPIPGATAASYDFNASYAQNGARFSVRVSNPYGATVSESAALAVDPLAPRFSEAPKEVTHRVGEPASFTAVAAGTGPLRLSWERSDDAGTSWKAIPGATGNQLDLPPLTLAWAETRLRVVATNPAGSVASAPVTLKVQAANRLVAGRPYGSGYREGVGEQARFSWALAAVIDSKGDAFVTDYQNHMVRRVTASGITSAFAGRAGQPFFDAPQGQQLLMYPAGLAIDARDTLYVVEFQRVRRISPQGEISALAGHLYERGNVDGAGAAARFGELGPLAADADGNLVVFDRGNQTVRRISKDGVVSTLAGKPWDRKGIAVDGKGDAARFMEGQAIAWARSGAIYLADGNAIRRISPAGEVSLYAGSYDPTQWADRDGDRRDARFWHPIGLVVDPDERLFITTDSGYLRRVDPDGTTYTLAGAGWTSDEQDGQWAAARMARPIGLGMARDGSRMVFIGQNGNSVREITPRGVVTTLAGPRATGYRPQAGEGAQAHLGQGLSLTQDARGRVLLATGDGSMPLLQLSSSGQGVVDSGMPGFADSPCPGAEGHDAAGNTYLLDRCYRRVIKVDAKGVMSTYAGSQDFTSDAMRDGPRLEARFGYLTGMEVAADGTVYLVDQNHQVIRKIDTAGMVSTLAGTPDTCGHRDGPGAQALFCNPMGLALDPQGRLHVADQSTNTVRRIEKDGTVRTVAGTPMVPGMSNGYAARLNSPRALAFDAQGNLYISDWGNAMVRRLTPEGFVHTVLGTGQRALQLNTPGGSINGPDRLLVRPDGRLLWIDENALVSD